MLFEGSLEFSARLPSHVVLNERYENPDKLPPVPRGFVDTELIFGEPVSYLVQHNNLFHCPHRFWNLYRYNSTASVPPVSI